MTIVNSIERSKPQSPVFFLALSLLLIAAVNIEAHPHILGSSEAPDSSITIPDSSRREKSIDDECFFSSEIFQNERILKEFIRHPKFQQLRLALSDTVAVDAIYLAASRLGGGNLLHALAIAFFATMDHYQIPFKLPWIRNLPFPLTGESREEFILRYHQLPNMPLSTTRYGQEHDKDKLQHFFGSAFLVVLTGSTAISLAIGKGIEWAEPYLVEGGANDERDDEANALGREFGFRLLLGEEILPSDVFLHHSPW
jgi:hypothetical protein